MFSRFYNISLRRKTYQIEKVVLLAVLSDKSMDLRDTSRITEMTHTLSP